MALQPCRRGLVAARRICGAQARIRALHSDARRTDDATQAPSPDGDKHKHTHRAMDRTPDPQKAAMAQFLKDLKAAELPEEDLPRWSQTPPLMKAPIQLNFAKNPKNKLWMVNTSPERLNEAYQRVLGMRGDTMLPEELKWLAVTHKSFDYGRRGFNDKLAVMGRATVLMEATKFIVSKEPMPHPEDPFQREPFKHPQLDPVDNLSVQIPNDLLGLHRLFNLADRYRLQDVMRWKPRNPDNLETAGIRGVLISGLFAIFGAVTLHQGSAVASRLVRERILLKIQSEGI